MKIQINRWLFNTIVLFLFVTTYNVFALVETTEFNTDVFFRGNFVNLTGGTISGNGSGLFDLPDPFINFTSLNPSFWSSRNDGANNIVYNNSPLIRVGIGTDDPDGKFEVLVGNQTFNVTPNVQANYNFEIGTTEVVIDASANFNQGLLKNGASRVESKGGNGTGSRAVEFDGLNDHIIIGEDIDLNLNGNFTFCAWVNSSVTSGTVVLIDKLPIAPATNGWELEKIASQRLRCSVGGDTALSTTAFNDDEWHHVCCVNNPDSALQIYVDGEEEANDTVLTQPADLTNDEDLFFGSLDGTGSFFTGRMDEIFFLDNFTNRTVIREVFNFGLNFTVVQVNNTFIVTDNGFVGIGVNDPISALDVFGTVSANDFITKSVAYRGNASKILSGARPETIKEGFSKIDHSSVPELTVTQKGVEGISLDKSIAVLIDANIECQDRITNLEQRLARAGIP